MRHGNTVNAPETTSKPVTREHKSKSARTIMETHTIEELNFERFLFSDMSKFNAIINKTETKVFSPKEYFVEITISHIPTFIIPKTLAEFKAFYKALKLRFSNIQWPEFPGALSMFKRKFQKKQVLNKILQNIVEVAKLRDKDKKALLGIFYAFFLDSQVIAKMKRLSTITQPTSQPTTQPPPDPKKSIASTTISENDNETDFQRIEEIQKDIEDRLQNIIHKDSGDDTSFREGDWSLPLVDSPTLVARTDVIRNPKHSNSLPGPLTPEGSSYKSENSHLDSDRLNKKSFDALEPVPSPPLVSRYSDPRGHPEQEGDRSQSFDDGDQLGLQEDGPDRNGYNRPRSIFKRGKGDSVNGPTSAKTTFVENEVINEEESPVGLSEKAKEKERKKEEKRKKKEEKKRLLEEAAKKRARGVSAGVKEIPNFSGQLYMRLSSESKWSKYFARLLNGCIVLYRSILESSPIHFLPVFRCELRYMSAKGGDYLEFWHSNDEDRFQITLVADDEEEDEVENTEANGDLAMWYEQIRIVSEKLTGLNLTSTNYSPIGKLQVVVYGAFEVKGLPNNSSCYVRLNHMPYMLSTSKTLRNDIMKWKQSFFIPLCDTFFPISVELVCVYNDGWITENLKEEVICTSEILIADIISLKSTNILTINLPMKYNDAKVKILAKQQGIAEKDLVHPKIEVRLKNLSSLKSYFAPPYADYIEGVKMDSDTFSKQLMKLSISRLKRIFTYIAIKMTELECIFNFKYPLFSYICLLLFVYFIIVFDVSSLAQDSILLIVMICAYKNPTVEKAILKHLDKLFFQQQHLNPFYTEPRIQTLEELDDKKLMGTEKWKYKLVDPDSLVTVFRKAKKSIITITIFLTKLTGFIEKFKNIITWKDRTRTVVFIIFSLFAYCFISVMSFRMIVLFGVVAKFITGINYYENLNKKNQETVKIALQFVIKECYPDLYNAIFNDTNTPWPTAYNFNVFQAKIVERMNDRLKINLPEDSLRIAKTPLDFILMLATSAIPLKCKMSPAEENSIILLKKPTPKFGLINIMYFIMNVPSDYYRVIHPKVIHLTEALKEHK